MRNLAILCIGLLAWLGSLSLILHSQFASKSPEVIHQVFPFDVTAGKLVVSSNLPPKTPKAELTVYRQTTENLIQRAPLDARTYSLLAVIDELEGDERNAQKNNETALTLKPTDLVGLVSTLSVQIRDRKFENATVTFDLMMKRHQRRAVALVGLMNSVLAAKNGRAAMVKLLATKPDWSENFLKALGEQTSSLGFAYQIQSDLLDQKTADKDQINTTIGQLIAKQQYQLAYRLFIRSQSERDKSLSGYIFNSDFTREPKKRVFDWQRNDERGVSVEWFQDASQTGVGIPEGPAVLLRFQGQPVKRAGLRQLVSLPPGKYRLETKVSANRARLPKGLKWNLLCIAPNRSDGQLNFKEGSYKGENFSGEFLVAEPCGVHILWVDTELEGESFRHRYLGSIIIHSASLVRITDE